MHFTHPTKSDKEYKQDAINCKVKAGQSGYVNAGIIQQRSFLQECMEGEGWVRE